MFDFIWNFFKGGINLAEKMATEKKVNFRLIVEVTNQNMELIKSVKHHEIRHVDNIRNNFANLMDDLIWFKYFIKMMSRHLKHILAILNH